MVSVVAKHTIHRRVDDEFHEIAPGTTFDVSDEEELEDLRKAKAIYESLEEKQQFEQASEGTFRRNKPGVIVKAVPAHALAIESALDNGEQPVVYDPLSSQGQQIKAGAEAVSRQRKSARAKREAALD